METFTRTMLKKSKDMLKGSIGSLSDTIGNTHIIGLSVNRDSDLIDESNWECIIADMDKQGLPYEIVRYGHWACGWVDYLIIAAANETAMLFIEDVLLQLDQYPVYNEDDWADREYTIAQSEVTDCIEYLYRCNDYSIEKAQAVDFIWNTLNDYHDVSWDTIEAHLAQYVVEDNE